MKLIWQGLAHDLKTWPPHWSRFDHDEPDTDAAREKIESGHYAPAPGEPELPPKPEAEPAESSSSPDHDHPAPVNPAVQAMQDAFNATPAAEALGAVPAAPAETPAPASA